MNATALYVCLFNNTNVSVCFKQKGLRKELQLLSQTENTDGESIPFGYNTFELILIRIGVLYQVWGGGGNSPKEFLEIKKIKKKDRS